MAEDKKSFIAYCDWLEVFEELDNEEAGRLVKHIFRYVNDLNPVAEDKSTKLCFIPIKQALKRDLLKYNAFIEKQKANGKKGGRPKKEETQKTQAFYEKPKKADNDNVNVNVNVNDTVNDIDKVNNTKNCKKEFSDDVILCVKNCIKYFDKELHPVTAKEKNSWCDTVDKLNRIDKLEFEVIEEIVKQIKKDDFWCSKFLSLNKLRNKNKDGVAYYKVFSQIIKRKNNGTNKKTSEQRAIEFAQRKAREREFGN